MPIDANIALGVQAPQFENPLTQMAQLEQLKGARQQNKLAELSMNERQRASEFEGKRRNALSAALNPETGEIDAAAYQKGLVGIGDFDGLQTFKKGQAEQSKVAREAEKAQLEQAMTKQKMVAQYAGAAKDQATWSQGLADLQKMGVDVSQVPQQYDPQQAAVLRDRALTGEQQLAQQWKAKEFDLDTKRFGETVRNNKTQNAISQGNLDVSRGQLGVSQANLGINREKLQQERAGGGKPMPASALKLQQEELNAIGAGTSINADLSAVAQQIDDGKLSFGPVSNLLNKGKNLAGMSDEKSRNLSSFKSSMERLRNESLRLNNGVQTDGDAQRAWNELFENINDTNLVKQRLTEIQRINDRAVKLRKMNVDNIRVNYGNSPMELSGYQNQPAAQSGGPAAKPNPSTPSAIPTGWSVQEN